MAYAARLLVATDFSPASTVAFEHAVALAGVCRASIHLLHVASGRADAAGNEHALAQLVVRCRAEGIVATSEVSRGAPAAAIVQAAADHAVDLVVIGTHSRSGIAHLMLGSVAEHVVRTAPCPVLTVRGGVPERVTAPLGAALELEP
jgi:nucleotide-binding universal stress UspA family protein